MIVHSRQGVPPDNTVDNREAGSALLQTLLLLPGIIIILLFFFQLILLFQAELVTSYAAFCAVRSAIVLNPDRLVILSHRGHIENDTEANDDEDLERVRRSAAFALIPISPTYSATLGSATQSPPRVEETVRLSSLAGLFPPRSGNAEIVGSSAKRIPYALSRQNTRVSLSVKPRPGQDSKVLLITAKVQYRYYLTIPIVGRLLGTTYPGSGFFGGYYYFDIDRSYTLPVEGDELFPESQRLEYPVEDNTP